MSKQRKTGSKGTAEEGTPAATQPSKGKSGKSRAALERELNRIDDEILSALSRRAEIALQIAGSNSSSSPGAAWIEQEESRRSRIAKANRGPIPSDSLRAIYREIASAIAAAKRPLRVTYLGPEFTFSHLAAIERFGQSAELVPVATIAAVFAEVEQGHASYGVVPMENSTDGRVSDTLECFSQSPVKICGELPLRIHHCLLGIGRREQLREVLSKPQALSQCRNWLANHLPHVTTAPMASTAEAAQRAKDDPEVAAIASRQVGAHYGLPVMAENIEDNGDNVTRFAIIGDQPAGRTGADKTSLVMELAHKPGALADAMAVFKRHALNLTWIESFPISGARGRYLFFVEFMGHQSDLRARRAIASLSKKTERLNVLGSYPAAEPVA